MMISLKADETRYIMEHIKTATDSHIFNIKNCLKYQIQMLERELLEEEGKGKTQWSEIRT